jgi:hypothetical protein
MSHVFGLVDHVSGQQISLIGGDSPDFGGEVMTGSGPYFVAQMTLGGTVLEGMRFNACNRDLVIAQANVFTTAIGGSRNCEEGPAFVVVRNSYMKEIPGFELSSLHFANETVEMLGYCTASADFGNGPVGRSGICKAAWSWYTTDQVIVAFVTETDQPVRPIASAQTDSANFLAFVADTTVTLGGVTFNATRDEPANVVIKVDNDGVMLWHKQLTASAGVSLLGLVLAGEDVLIHGAVYGASPELGYPEFGANGAFVALVSKDDGLVRWGAPFDNISTVVADPETGDVYVAGYQGPEQPAEIGAERVPGGSRYVARLSGDGEPLWASQEVQGLEVQFMSVSYLGVMVAGIYSNLTMGDTRLLGPAVFVGIFGK